MVNVTRWFMRIIEGSVASIGSAAQDGRRSLERQSSAFHTWLPASETATNKKSNLRGSRLHPPSVSYQIEWCESNISNGAEPSRNPLFSQPHNSRSGSYKTNYASSPMLHRLQKQVLHMADRLQSVVKPGESRVSGSITLITPYSFEVYNGKQANLKLLFWVNVQQSNETRVVFCKAVRQVFTSRQLGRRTKLYKRLTISTQLSVTTMLASNPIQLLLLWVSVSIVPCSLTA